MWQSSMLISLLVLSPEQILIWENHDSLYSGPIALLEPLVVLIGSHKDMLNVIHKREWGGGFFWLFFFRFLRFKIL